MSKSYLTAAALIRLQANNFEKSFPQLERAFPNTKELSIRVNFQQEDELCRQQTTQFLIRASTRTLVSDRREVRYRSFCESR